MEHLIIRIKLQSLKNETHVEINENVDRVFVKYNPQSLGVDALYNRYKQALIQEVDALDFISKSGFTQKITVQDHQRDVIYRGAVDTVNAALHHFNPDYREAAQTIENIMKHYGNIAKKTFDDETAAIDDLIRELHQPVVAQAVNQIGLAPWRDKLQEENTRFKQLMTERYNESAGKTSLRMRTARVETDKYYHAMVTQIENNHLAGIVVNEAFLKELNAVIERFKHILAQEIGERKPKPAPNEN
jgi:hypothetical protein